MRAIGYFRPRAGGPSQEEFRKEFQDYCDRYVHQPMETFCEAGSDSVADYPEYRRLLEHVRQPGGNYLVVVLDVGHLGSDLEAVARAVVELELAGSKVTCADDDMPDPLQSAFAFLGVKGVSRDRSDRIKASMRERALMGKGLGKPPYGYRNGPDGTLEVVPEELPVVELIYRLYTKDGLGLRLISQHLNERGISTRRKGNWNMVTIRDILRNPTYMGTYTRFGLRLPKSHEAIIPGKVFREAQDETRSRRPVGRVTNSEPFLLSGLAHCAYCDNKMMGVTRRQSWKRKDGRRANGVYRYYQCQSRNNQSVCQYHTWRAPLLESTVLTQLKYALQARGAANGDSGIATNGGEAKAIWESRVRNAERRFLQAMRRAARGAMTLDILAEYLNDLDAARKGAENSAQPTNIAETLDGWESLDFGQRQLFFMEHVAKIVVKDDSVDVAV